ncbi:MAG: hypothetical protein KGQ49_03390 [Verrucomicrobia bacterium]|nr:hypothetical protein [Verrucomicrobiota bacterium]MBU6446425.1 hypothetical protein [Verrucomicrobiota bacterium]MDE3047834.1 hypothetical protein [Verrucomicrobiota bacterium]
MLETNTLRKNKIHLSDYPYAQDVECRMLMSDFSTLDIEIMEEILYSPLKISLKKLARSLGCDETALQESLRRFASVGLLSIAEDAILIDKEKRKYFEFEMTRFEPHFKPDMEFLQGLLRKVPIQVLPSWYAIPRTSNNIFESIVEKYLFTPHIFQRYLADLHFADPTLNAIIQDVFQSPDLKVSSSDLIAKYNLTAKSFEEMILLLEFHFACCLIFEKEGDHWLEYVTPFHEWREYLCFFRATEPVCLDPRDPIESRSVQDFAFIEEMSSLLLQAKPKKIAVAKTRAVEKLVLLKLAEYEGGLLHALEAGDAWLDLSLENRALFLYRHPQNRILSLSAGERYVREAEKSIKRVLHGGWVYFDDFLKGVLVPLNEQSVVMLKKGGKHWKYTLPVYGEEEKKLLHATIFEWLYEFGMVTIGKCRGRDCFAATPFGRFFFED